MLLYYKHMYLQFSAFLFSVYYLLFTIIIVFTTGMFKMMSGSGNSFGSPKSNMNEMKESWGDENEDEFKSSSSSSQGGLFVQQKKPLIIERKSSEIDLDAIYEDDTQSEAMVQMISKATDDEQWLQKHKQKQQKHKQKQQIINKEFKTKNIRILTTTRIKKKNKRKKCSKQKCKIYFTDAKKWKKIQKKKET